MVGVAIIVALIVETVKLMSILTNEINKKK